MRTFYTDGSFTHQGGWAWIEVSEGQVVAMNKGQIKEQGLTSACMELNAIIEALYNLKEGEQAIIYCDSQEILNNIEKIEELKNQGWTKKNKDLDSPLLWKKLYNLLIDRKITWKWIRSHNKHIFNEMVDKMSRNEEINKIQNISEGLLFHTGEPAKKYVVTNTQIKLAGKTGFLAVLLSNSLGEEREFFSLNIILQEVKPSAKEKATIYKILERSSIQAKAVLDSYSNDCTHTIKKKKNTDGAYCCTCDTYFGWWCPDSPDHTCHYHSQDGMVELINHKKAPVPLEHNVRFEDDDTCIFCGSPEERK